MSNKQTTQPQHAAFEMFAQLTRDNLDRVNTWAGELAEIEATSYDYLKGMIGHGPKLAAEWRRVALESTKKAANLWTAQG